MAVNFILVAMVTAFAVAMAMQILADYPQSPGHCRGAGVWLIGLGCP